MASPGIRQMVHQIRPVVEPARVLGVSDRPVPCHVVARALSSRTPKTSVQTSRSMQA